jgi:hypothetical protein
MTLKNPPVFKVIVQGEDEQADATFKTSTLIFGVPLVTSFGV